MENENIKNKTNTIKITSEKSENGNYKWYISALDFLKIKETKINISKIKVIFRNHPSHLYKDCEEWFNPEIFKDSAIIMDAKYFKDVYSICEGLDGIIYITINLDTVYMPKRSISTCMGWHRLKRE